MCHGRQVPPMNVPLSDEVKYPGVYLVSLSLSNKRKSVSYRIPQAMSASKLLHPLVGHAALPP